MAEKNDLQKILRPKILLLHDASQTAELDSSSCPIDGEWRTVHSTTDALACFREGNLALLIADLDTNTLPIWDMLNEVKTLPQLQTTALLLLSGRLPEPNQWQLLTELRADFAMKPVQPLSLQPRIKLLLELHAMRVTMRTLGHADHMKIQENLLDQIFRDSTAGMSLTVGPQHVYTMVNRKFYELTGIAESLLGKSMREAMPESESNGYLTLMDQVYQSGQIYAGIEVPIMVKGSEGQNRELIFDFTYQPLLNEKGEVYAILSQGYDVTEKVLTRRALERSKRMIENIRLNFMTLFEHTPELVAVLTGPDHVFEFVNDAYIRALGFKPLGQRLKVAQPESVEIHSLCDEIFKNAGARTFQEQPVTLGGRLRYFNATYSAFRSDEGAPTGVIILGADVTEQVLFRRALQSSQARFQRLADSMPQLVYVSMPDGTVTFLNEGWKNYTGARDEYLGTRSTIDFIHPDDRDRCSTAFHKACREKSPLDCEIRLRDRHGNYRWFVTRARPHIQNDAIIEWFGTSTDIHDQKLAAEELQRSRERYRIVFEDSPVPMWITNPDASRFLDLNNMAIKTYGYTREEFLQMSVTDVLLVEDYDAFWATMKETTLTEDRYLHTQARHKRKDGSILHVEITLRDLMLDGSWQRIAAMVDVTRRIVAEEQLRQLMQKLQGSKEEAERANQLKSAFLANMSHEIRTPLGAMLGFADLLRDPNISREEHSNYLDILVRNGEQLSIIINDILDLSKVEAGHLTLEFIEVNLRDIVRDVLALLEIKAREKNLALHYEPDASTPYQVTSDPVRVRQVLLNLMSNAIKFTAHGHVQVRSFGERNEQGRMQVSFEITDSGIGIAADQVERIFEMFVQADDSTTRKFGGTGLGLALSRKLARALGGDVRVLRSEPNAGSTFLFTLTDLPELRDEKAGSATADQALPGPDQASLEGLHILVVDDAPDIRSLISFLLARAGAVVDFAENGLEGYRKALGQDYDLVLMDIQMPQMDGYTATMKLREQGYHRPIIALTAHAMTESRKKCLSVGCTGHLPKPINPANLLGIVALHARH